MTSICLCILGIWDIELLLFLGHLRFTDLQRHEAVTNVLHFRFFDPMNQNPLIIFLQSSNFILKKEKSSLVGVFAWIKHVMRSGIHKNDINGPASPNNSIFTDGDLQKTTNPCHWISRYSFQRIISSSFQETDEAAESGLVSSYWNFVM